MGSDFSIISDFYNAFIGVINGGFVSIQPDVNYLMSAMIVITIIMAAITTFVWGDVETVTKGLFLKILLIGFFSYLVENWETVTGTIVSSFVTIGLKGGGATLTAHQFESQPEAVMAIGLNLFTGCLDVISPYMNYWDFFTYFITILVYVVAGLVVIVAFAVITVQIFITFIEFKLIALAAWILIPFGIWTRTNFLSERALGYTFSVGIKMLVLALIVSIGQALFSDITLSEEPNINNALSVAIAAILLMATAIFAPSYAGALIGGGPQTGLGTLAAGAAAGAAVAAAPYLAARGAASSMVSRYQAASGAASMSASQGGGRLAQIAAAAQGALRPSSVGAGGASGGNGGGQGAGTAEASAGGSSAAGGGSGPAGGSNAPAGGRPSSTPSSSASGPAGGAGAPAAGAGAGGGSTGGASESPWYQQSGGASSLSPTQTAAAQRAYQAWGGGSGVGNFSFGEYVAYAQGREAARTDGGAGQGPASAAASPGAKSSPTSALSHASNAVNLASDAGPGITNTTPQQQEDEH